MAGSDNVAQAAVGVLPSSDVVDFRFAAQPFEVAPGRDHVVLATGLGPAFVIAAAGGKTAAERAYEVQQRLNQAGTLLKASRDVDIELRNPDTAPALALVGKPETLLEVTEEDAAAYNEDWTGLKGRGGPVTRARLGRWWEAVAKDLVLMLVRGQQAGQRSRPRPGGTGPRGDLGGGAEDGPLRGALDRGRGPSAAAARRRARGGPAGAALGHRPRRGGRGGSRRPRS